MTNLLPIINGTEKQIAFAASLRESVVLGLLKRVPAEKHDEAIAIFNDKATTDAVRWIDTMVKHQIADRVRRGEALPYSSVVASILQTELAK